MSTERRYALIGHQHNTNYAPLVHSHSASDVISGMFADALIGESSVTQHEDALTLEAIYEGANKVLDSITTGVRLIDPSGSNPVLNLADSSLNDLGRLTASATNLNLHNLNHGGSVTITGQDAGGVVRTLVTADPGGGVGFFNKGVLHGLVDVIGLACINSSTLNDTANKLRFLNNGFSEQGFLGYNPDGNLKLRNQVHGALLQLQGEDTGGVNRTMVSCDPDGSVIFYYNGTGKCRTNIEGFQVDNGAIAFSSTAANFDQLWYDDLANTYYFTSDEASSKSTDTQGTTVQAGRLRLESTSDASQASTLHAFQIGPTSGNNVIIDNNEILSRSNGASSALHLNIGGELTLAASGGRLGFFTTTTQSKLIVTGAKGGNAALTSLLTQLASYGLITNSTT